jgi:hypothetical protein
VRPVWTEGGTIAVKLGGDAMEWRGRCRGRGCGLWVERSVRGVRKCVRAGKPRNRHLRAVKPQ